MNTIEVTTEKIVKTNITRVELISEHGRVYVLSRNSIENVDLSLQDSGKTLKIFFNYKDLEK